MPRSYRFDHFQVRPAEPRSRSLRREDKQHLADTLHSSPGGDGGIHYGGGPSQTEEHLKGRPFELPEEPPAPRTTEAPRSAPETPRLYRNTTPIGALPATEELPPRGRFQDLVDEAARQLDALQGGIGDVSKAAVRLASLPLEVVRLAARRLRLVHG